MNNITTIDSHVLLPHQADWNRRPSTERIWKSGVDTALGGNEDRASVRPAAWMKLTFSLLPFNHVERARIDDRMRAAIKAGKLAVPLWGKGVPIREDATTGHEQLNLVRSNHGITAGKYVLIQPSVPAEFDTWDLCLVDSVSGARLNLAAGISNDYAAGTYCWPLLYGKPMPEEFQVMSPARGRYTVSVQFDQRQINAFAFDNFGLYDLGEVTDPLNGGDGWAGPWVFGIAA